MRIKQRSILSIILVASIILFMQPYFTWSSYPYHLFFNILQYIILFVGMAFSLQNLCVNIHKISTAHIFSTGIFAVFSFYFYCTGENSLIGHWGILAQYFFILLYFTLDDSLKRQCFDSLRKVFAVLLIPSIIVFVLKTVDFQLPYTLLEDYHSASTRIYLHFPLSILTATIYSISTPMMRLCGFLDEPGALGTFISLILCATDFNLKDRYNQILLLAGCLTLSTAFFILSITYFILAKIVYLFPHHKISKLTLWSILLILAAIVLLGQTSFLKTSTHMIFNKFHTRDLRGTNYILDQTKAEFGNNFPKYIFGNGLYSGNYDGNFSWPILLHDVGIIGILLTIIYILFIQYNRKWIWKKEVYRFLMLLSLLQRPYILTIPYILIYTMGLLNLESQSPKITFRLKYANTKILENLNENLSSYPRTCGF